MVSPENTNWLYDYGFEDITANFAAPSSGFSWPVQPLTASTNASVEIDGSYGESDSQKDKETESRKSNFGALFSRFMELGALLEPGRPPKTDKLVILIDAVRMVTQLRSEAQKLKDSNSNLQEKIKELKTEKNELRDEKQRLKAEKEKLEQQLKTMSAPQPGFVPATPSIPPAFAAQNQAGGNKLVPIISYPGVSMWQFMPPAAVDTSQDHHESRISPKCSLSSPKPPTTKEEAILQAKTSLSSTLERPLNNPKLPGKMKKIKQPRLRVEIPVVDDSPASLSVLAIQVFAEMPIRRKGPQIKILLLWPSYGLMQAATEAFASRSSNITVQSIDMSSVLDEDVRTMNSADVAVFFAPEAAQLAIMKTVSDSLSPRPVVIFNPRWSFDEEADFGEMSGFLGSFEVVYSFMGLEVRGILSKRKGVIFNFKSRPSIVQVETVLYNLMAINSPVTKSAKFLKDLVSNVTGKK
ncbi:hypothetical protein SASPL_114212 [Salvia splendens]|uniref:DUF1995 domain-containing protein n=1 Tax=Salvia splendens TaxID=180675 RepID=A0A8X9A1T8_SALSN|nr:hypothetical protein SASPL_114212 [Salvia splendens]